jgi:hypothetical protein
LCQSICPTRKSEPTFGGSPGLKAVFILASRRRRARRPKNRMRAESRSLNCILYAVCPFCQVYRPITAMEFGRNLRFTTDLNDFPEFSCVRLWTLGISQNAGMIRARAQIRSGTRKQAFLNHAVMSEVLLYITHYRSRRYNESQPSKRKPPFEENRPPFEENP